MGRYDYYAPGDWNVLCSMCGHKFKASELTKNWQGQYRCRTCQEPRHPQDFVKAIPEREVPAWVQPRPTAVFLPLCTPSGMTGIAGIATSGCALPNFVHPAYDPSVEE